MKKLILCEGKHDCTFFEKLFPKMNISVSEVKFFNQETRDNLRNLMDAETKELRSFSEKYNPYKILVKSEGGDDKAIKIFSRYLEYCICKQQKGIEKTILMLDLDNRGLRNKLEDDRLKENSFEKRLGKLEQMIDGRRVGDPIYLEREIIKKTDSIYLVKNKLKTKENKKQIGNPFYLVLFVYSLEEELNKIDPSNDASIEDKISQLVELQDIKRTFSLNTFIIKSYIPLTSFFRDSCYFIPFSCYIY